MITRPQDSAALPEAIPLWRIGTDRYLRMIDAGVLGPDDQVELMDGMIVPMSPAGPKHNHVLSNLTRLFAPAFENVVPSVQGTLTLGEGHVFDPDFMLLRPRQGGYKERLPEAADVLLLIEVSDASLQRDRQVKLPIYAAAGVADYWIADLERATLIVHREPEGEGYSRVETFRGGQRVSPLALPDHALDVHRVFE